MYVWRGTKITWLPQYFSLGVLRHQELTLTFTMRKDNLAVWSSEAESHTYILGQWWQGVLTQGSSKCIYTLWNCWCNPCWNNKANIIHIKILSIYCIDWERIRGNDKAKSAQKMAPDRFQILYTDLKTKINLFFHRK